MSSRSRIFVETGCTTSLGNASGLRAAAQLHLRQDLLHNISNNRTVVKSANTIASLSRSLRILPSFLWSSSSARSRLHQVEVWVPKHCFASEPIRWHILYLALPTRLAFLGNGNPIFEVERSNLLLCCVRRASDPFDPSFQLALAVNSSLVFEKNIMRNRHT